MRWGLLSVVILKLEVDVTQRLLVGLSVVVDLLGLEVGRSVGGLMSWIIYLGRKWALH